LKLALVLLAVLALPAWGQGLKSWTGGPTPALELADTEGKLHRLSAYRGSAVLVNFWATWCVPCREEMPSIEALRTALHDKDKPFVVLAVNVGESARVAREFAGTMMLGFPLLLDRDTRTTKAWGARVLPAIFVVGHDGRIRYGYLGALDWASPEVRTAIERLVP
jgi:peroxiredoxin